MSDCKIVTTERRPTAVIRLKAKMSDLREAMWGVVQQGLSTLDFDYVDSVESFARAYRTDPGWLDRMYYWNTTG